MICLLIEYLEYVAWCRKRTDQERFTPTPYEIFLEDFRERPTPPGFWSDDEHADVL